jgi:hypothetical protein
MYDILIPYLNLGEHLPFSNPLLYLRFPNPLLQPHYSTSLSPYIWAFKDLQQCNVIGCLYGQITWQSKSGMKAAPLGNCSPLGMTTDSNMTSQQQNSTNKKLK